jgi:hypothetical protein
VDERQAARRHRAERVHLGLERAQRGEQLRGGGLVAEVGAVDRHEGAAGEELGDVRQRRDLDQARARADLVGRGAGPLDPGLEDLGAALPRPQHHPGVDRRVRVQLDLDGGHDAVVAAAAAQRPEQVGVVVVGGADERAVGGHELDRADAVGGEAVLAGEPREAAAEHVADDADVGARAGQRGEPEPRRRAG